MAEVTLRVTCDRAVACQFGVTFGTGWARVQISTPPPADWGDLTPLLRSAKALLDLMRATPAEPRPRVVVDGPDVPPDNRDDAHGAVFRAWVLVLRGPEGLGDPAQQQQPQPQQQAYAPPSARASAPAPAALPLPDFGGGGSAAGAGAETRAETRPPRLLQPAAPRGGRGRAASAEEELVEKMVRTVQAYVKSYGAAPDFQAEGTAARGKAYNYIRSTSANQRASDDLVEKVRKRLAGD